MDLLLELRECMPLDRIGKEGEADTSRKTAFKVRAHTEAHRLPEPALRSFMILIIQFYPN